MFIKKNEYFEQKDEKISDLEENVSALESQLEEVNNKIVKFVEFINERSKEKKVRFSENILKVFIEQEIDEIIIKWKKIY